MTPPLKYPFYIKAPLILVGIYTFISMLYIGQSIIVPFIYSILIAIVLRPLVNFLVRKKLPRILAIAITMLLAFTVIFSIGALLVSQASMFRDALPKLIDRLHDLYSQVLNALSNNYNISNKQTTEWVAKAKTEVSANGGNILGRTINTMGNLIMVMFLMPVYIFMLLFYQPHIVLFIHKAFGTDNDTKVSEILGETKTIVKSYLMGMLLEATIVAALYSAGLLLLGVPYAILLGILGAFLNLIPYIGSIVAGVLSMTISLLTQSNPSYSLLVLGLYILIQFIDNNYIIPYLVGSKVQINALISMLAIIGVASLWGIAGMFLAIPLTAILKLIFDRIRPLNPWGFLIGDPAPIPRKKLKLPKRS